MFSCLGLARFAYSMLLPSMGKALRLGYDQMGYIGTGNFAGYLAAVAMAPFLMHWWGARRTITFGLALLASCMILMGHGAWQTLGPALAGIAAKYTGTFSTSYLLAAAATGAAVLISSFLRNPHGEEPETTP
ncbi:MAG: YbfB/YjiJ family MFS transporter [Candidatus Deferrimicrobiaceae bacterium]